MPEEKHDWSYLNYRKISKLINTFQKTATPNDEKLLVEELQKHEIDNCFETSIDSKQNGSSGHVNADMPAIARWFVKKINLINVLTGKDDITRWWKFKNEHAFFTTANEQTLKNEVAILNSELKELPIKTKGGVSIDTVLGLAENHHVTTGNMTAFDNGVVDYSELIQNPHGSTTEKLARIKFIDDKKQLDNMILLDGIAGISFPKEILSGNYTPDNRWLEYFEYMFKENAKGMVQLFGNMFELNYRHNQIVHIQSRGGTGKSAFIKTLTKPIENEVISIDSEAMFDKNNQFGLQSSIGAKGAIDDDADNRRPNMSAMKRYTGNGRQTINRKNLPAVTVDMYAKLFIITNEKFAKIITDSGVQRRVIAIKVEAPTTTDENGNTDHEKVVKLAKKFPSDQLSKTAGGFLCWAFIENLLVNGKWDIVKNYNSELEVTDYYAEFLNQYTVKDTDVENGIDVRSLFNLYQLYMRDLEGSMVDKTTLSMFKKELIEKREIIINKDVSPASPDGLYGIPRQKINTNPYTQQKDDTTDDKLDRAMRNRLKNIVLSENAVLDFDLVTIEDKTRKKNKNPFISSNDDPDNLPF